MRHKNLTFISGLVVLAISPIAHAQSVAETETAVEQDQFQSQKLTREERKELRKRLRIANRNRGEKRLNRMDLNEDQLIDLTEYLSNAEKRFNKLDADGDGYVTREEARDRHRELIENHRMKRKQIRDSLIDESKVSY